MTAWNGSFLLEKQDNGGGMDESRNIRDCQEYGVPGQRTP